MKKVLIVDDDESFLHSLIDGFKAYEDQFTVITAGDGIEALTTLRRQKINLVLTDLKMPRMDGFELIAQLSSHYAEIPIIVMTAFGTPAMENSLREMGTFKYIEKPIDFSLLVKLIIEDLDGPSKGFVTGVSLSSFLQLLELDTKTCTLTIHAGNKTGTMYFRDGDLLDARAMDLSGSAAAHFIVGWKNVEIEIENHCPAMKSRIKESLGFILLEGCRKKDEDAAESNPSPVTDGGLESLNMEDFDLHLSDDAPVQPAVSLPPQEPQKPESALTQFITLLSTFPEINSSTISTKEGKVLHLNGDSDNNTANFCTYVAVAADKLESTIGATGREYTIFTLTDDTKLLILCGQNVIVSLKLDSSAIPENIVKGLRPVLSRITFQA